MRGECHKKLGHDEQATADFKSAMKLGWEPDAR